jgi:hypothetical protein
MLPASGGEAALRVPAFDDGAWHVYALSVQSFPFCIPLTRYPLQRKRRPHRRVLPRRILPGRAVA